MVERISASWARRCADSAASRRLTTSSGWLDLGESVDGDERREIRDGENCEWVSWGKQGDTKWMAARDASAPGRMWMVQGR